MQFQQASDCHKGLVRTISWPLMQEVGLPLGALSRHGKSESNQQFPALFMETEPPVRSVSWAGPSTSDDETPVRSVNWAGTTGLSPLGSPVALCMAKINGDPELPSAETDPWAPGRIVCREGAQHIWWWVCTGPLVVRCSPETGREVRTFGKKCQLSRTQTGHVAPAQHLGATG